MKRLFATAGLALLSAGLMAGSAGAAPLNVVEAKAAIDKGLASDYAHLDALYKDLHAHPELGFQEQVTAARLAKEMRALGLEVTEGVGKTGVVAILRNGPGPLVLVRTELDALPLEEKTGLPYASTAKQMRDGKETFVDHACGHDIHMTVWVGAAQRLVAMKKSWSGTVMFVGQPAEEITGGAKAMLADDLFKRFGKPDLGFALHVGPDPAGVVTFKSGVLTSNSDELHILFKGRGAHGSMPNMGIDPVLEMSRFVVEVQSVISREKDPQAFGVITVGSVQAGNAGNVIPDLARLAGTIRTYDAGVRAKMLAGIDRTAKAVADMEGAPAPEVRIVEGGKAVINDEAITEKTGAVFKKAFGDKAVRLTQPSPPSEDYSEFIIAGVPSLFFGIGGSDPAAVAAAQAGGKPVPVNHSPYFAPVPEPTIKTGVEAMTLALINAMPKK